MHCSNKTFQICFEMDEEKAKKHENKIKIQVLQDQDTINVIEL